MLGGGIKEDTVGCPAMLEAKIQKSWYSIPLHAGTAYETTL